MRNAHVMRLVCVYIFKNIFKFIKLKYSCGVFGWHDLSIWIWIWVIKIQITYLESLKKS